MIVKTYCVIKTTKVYQCFNFEIVFNVSLLLLSHTIHEHTIFLMLSNVHIILMNFTKMFQLRKHVCHQFFLNKISLENLH